MMDNRGINGSGMLAGFIVGSLVGAGVALLIAPSSGQDARRRLGESMKGLGEKARDLASDAGQELRDGVREAKTKIEGVKDRVTHGVHEVKQDVKDAYDAGRQAARS